MTTEAQTMPVGVSSEDTLDPGKMFVGGLSWQTTADGLKEYFSRFGEVSDAMVMRDPATKRSRGFGFVTYEDAKDVDKVLSNGQHTLDQKEIDPKVAIPRKVQTKFHWRDPLKILYDGAPTLALLTRGPTPLSKWDEFLAIKK